MLETVSLDSLRAIESQIRSCGRIPIPDYTLFISESLASQIISYRMNANIRVTVKDQPLFFYYDGFKICVTAKLYYKA